MSAEISQIVNNFKNEKEVEDSIFKEFLIDFGKELRVDLIQYFNTQQNIEFARYLLKKAIELRKLEDGYICMEDLACFSFLLGRHQQIEDSLLIWEAKNVDFDTYCGFDGELVCFMGLDATLNYLRITKSKEALEALRYFESYEQKSIDFYFSSQSHYYL